MPYRWAASLTNAANSLLCDPVGGWFVLVAAQSGVLYTVEHPYPVRGRVADQPVVEKPVRRAVGSGVHPCPDQVDAERAGASGPHAGDFC